MPRLADTFDWDAAPRVVDEAENVPATSSTLAPDSVAVPAAAAEGSDDDGAMDAEDADGEGAALGRMGGAKLLQGWAQANDGTKKKKQKRAPTKRVMSATSADDESYNFQANRGIRKNQKLEQKKARRNAAAARMFMAE